MPVILQDQVNNHYQTTILLYVIYFTSSYISIIDSHSCESSSVSSAVED
uniref:Uncharacterized protein n=1 Tax=Anguilla anguilla TaxID=7936 RepID=A0A0E9WGI5_ANGAN